MLFAYVKKNKGAERLSPTAAFVFSTYIVVYSCIPDEKIQVNPRFWSGLEILV